MKEGKNSPGYYAIGRSNKVYSGYRPLTMSEVLEHQYELLDSHEKYGGILALDNFTPSTVILTPTHWIGVNGDNYLQCGDKHYTDFFVSKGTFVPLFSEPSKKSFKTSLPLNQKHLTNGYEKREDLPSFFIKID